MGSWINNSIYYRKDADEVLAQARLINSNYNSVNYIVRKININGR